MQTYIANCTHQRQIVNFRLPETRKVTTQTIPMGRQLLIGDLSPLDVKAIEEQLGPYGLVAESDITNAKRKITYVYSTGAPVTAANIWRAIERNKGILTSEGRKRREEAAVASNSAMNTEETPLNKLEMSVEEVSSGSMPSDEPVAQGFRIDNTVDTSENRRPRRRTVRA